MAYRNDAFRRAFARVIRRAGDKVELVTKKVILEMFVSLVNKSPVDTGRFRANWVVGYGTINTFAGHPPDKTGAGAITMATMTIDRNFRIGRTIWLTNSLPYAKRLEEGWSQQAPNGMVELTMVEYASHLRRLARSLKK